VEKEEMKGKPWKNKRNLKAIIKKIT